MGRAAKVGHMLPGNERPSPKCFKQLWIRNDGLGKIRSAKKISRLRESAIVGSGGNAEGLRLPEHLGELEEVSGKKKKVVDSQRGEDAKFMWVRWGVCVYKSPAGKFPGFNLL